MSNLPKIENITLQILRMDESSGNIQIFVRAKRADDNSSKLFQETLEYQCFQTKHIEYKECLSRAWFSATELCNFFGHHPDDIVFYGLNESDIKTIKSSLSMYRGT